MQQSMGKLVVALGLLFILLTISLYVRASALAQAPPRASVRSSPSKPAPPRFEPHAALPSNPGDGFAPPGFALPAGVAPGFGVSPQPRGTPVAVDIELWDGQRLRGHTDSNRAWPVTSLLGATPLPITLIRGLRAHQPAESTTKVPTAQGPTATVILANDDSLTVQLQEREIDLVTSWGRAMVQVSQIQSMLVGDESADFQQAAGRWQLVPRRDAPAAGPVSPPAEEPASPDASAPEEPPSVLPSPTAP
ncbi:MAG: hypothetical protein AB7F89_17410 [Pirellulaceae bacterium]